MAVKAVNNKTSKKQSIISSRRCRYAKVVTAAMGCASLLGEASAFSPSSSSSTTVMMMEARLSPSPSSFAASSRSSKDAYSSSVTTTTTLWYRNGDGAQDLKQDEQQRSTNLVDSPRSSGLIPYLLQRCKITKKNPHNCVTQEDQEDYDLTSYLQYVNERYERLHLDDEVVVAPQESKTRKMVHHNQESLISNSFQPSATQHSDALYALSWAGHFAEQIHAPWTNSNIKDVSSEELNGTEFESVASSSTRVSKRLSLIAKVSSIQTRLLAMQYRTIAKIAGLVLDRARKMTELLAKRGAYRVKLAMSLATVLFLVAVRPVTSVVSKS
mmetsp:Transcript_28051/g.43636  ORF Transcript_28051/g.43636 Transcript_28051/m.43636 type:complete len:327 (+) Transcript_28051:54-1034(+)|eukprot:CAMPEP_0196810666 /NCGR_PEP_ID=MMETSP1362-20130617/13226_1 /TAXON_ID=163516 /ORGANISM="Leptocylindrus danicus, Strain CCMP1856" /LENGTH=326 /DNA_ID=CAMNT_0042185771 /DNA_START=54 /DNA_END=1034 /DNA_ORIENTATION=+